MLSDFELLVHLCGIARGLPVQPGQSVPEALSALNAEALFAMAVRHKVLGTAYAGLKTSLAATSAAGPGAAVIGGIKRRIALDRADRSLILQDWRLIAEAFRKRNMPLLTIKGPAASLQLYGDALAREYGDLDLLVDIPDLRDVLPVMEELGFVATTHTPQISGSPSHSYVRTWHHVAFRKGGRSFSVEIHDRTWKTHKDNFGESVGALMARSETVEYAGASFPTLGRADHGVYLFSHGAEHAWCLLHWVLDAATLLNSADESLHRDMAARVVELNMEKLMAVTIRVVQSVYPAVPIPGPWRAMEAKYRLAVAGPVRFALERLRAGGSEDGSIRNLLRFSTAYRIPLATSARAKMAAFAEPFLVNQEHVEALPLPRFLHPLYLPLRPFIVVYGRAKKAFTKGKKHT